MSQDGSRFGDSDATAPAADDLASRLAALREKMVAGLPARAAQLREAARGMTSIDASSTADARRVAHRLAGIAGSHGFHSLTDEARAAERLIDARAPLQDLLEAVLGLAATCEAVSKDPDAFRSHEPPRRSDAVAPRRSVLAVEDDEATAQLLALTLGRIGNYAPTVVDSAEAALALLDDRVFDLVLVDAMLPGMNGLEFTRRVRQGGGKRPDVPIVVLSAASASDLGWDLEAEGDVAPNGWLRKPIRARSLLDDLEILLHHAHAPER